MAFTPASMPKRSVIKEAKKSPSWLAGVTASKEREQAFVKNCRHVINGAVWCIACASSYRKRARELYSLALSSPKNDGNLIRLAQERLKKALHEYALTSEGIAELQAEYVKLASLKSVDASSTYEMIKRLTKEASERNSTAKQDHANHLARLKTVEIEMHTLNIPNKDAQGNFTLWHSSFIYTAHAKERMVLRGITHEDMKATYSKESSIVPGGQGKWTIVGKDGLTMCGFFKDVGKHKKFVVTTVYYEEKMTEADISHEVSLLEPVEESLEQG